ncbi:hypothetical protein J4W93_19965, partial [Escherichia coli]
PYTMPVGVFIKRFNKQNSNNYTQCDYLKLLIVLTIAIAKATDSTVFTHQANIINTDLFCGTKK